MEITIEQTTFENALPCALSPQSLIFEKVQPQFQESVYVLEETVLGEAGAAKIEASTDAMLLATFRKAVCLHAFLSVLRQLDLVLTPSGFGVVSSDKYAPASKMRVDALEGQLRTTLAKTQATLVNLMRSAEWGTSVQAEDMLPSVYSPFVYFAKHPTASYQSLEEFQLAAIDADTCLRNKMSAEQMDAIVKRYRCGTNGEDDRAMHQLIQRFTDRFVNNGFDLAVRTVWPRIARLLNDNLEYWAEWAASDEYQAFIHPVYENSQDSAAYIFG